MSAYPGWSSTVVTGAPVELPWSSTPSSGAVTGLAGAWWISAAKWQATLCLRPICISGGSCFAQRVAEAVRGAGFNYYLTEPPTPGMSAEEANARQFGTFSARYGNLYYTRQFVQLFDRAYSKFEPELKAWLRDDGRYVDPFRPTVEPAGFASEAEVVAARDAHLAEVRRLFETLDVFVLTLGLTEGWRWRADGAALPLAPGVAGGTFDRQQFLGCCVRGGQFRRRRLQADAHGHQILQRVDGDGQNQGRRIE